MKKSFLQNIVIWLSAAVIFIMPLKFAGIIGIPEVAPMFPRSLIALIIITWPPLLFALIAAILLILSALCMPPDFSKNRNLWICAGLWMFTFAISFLGYINASTYIFPYIEMTHLGGIICFMLSAAIILSERPDAKKIMAISLILGLIVTLLLGVDQFVNGFKDTMEFINQRENKTGVELAGDFKVRVGDVRVFSTFASSNALGGFILLTFPLAFALIYKYSTRIEPSKISRPLFMGLFGLLALFIFGYTRSRAAYLSLIAMLTFCIILFPVNRKLKIATCILVPLAIIGAALVISMTERSFASMRVRVDYILRSAEIMAAHPFAGTGWGDFFHDYMTIKTYPTSEAPHMPHNIIMAFAGQTGIMGGLAVIAAILWPLYVVWQKMRQAPLVKKVFTLNGAIFCGLLAFFIHGMFDVHLQVPANMAAALLLSILAMTPDVEKTDAPTPGKSKRWLKLLAITICLAFGAMTFYHSRHLLRYQEAFERLLDLCDRRTKTPEEYMQIPRDKVTAGLRECVELLPQSPFPWFTVGDFMMSHRQPHEAEQMYLKALALSPQRASLHIRLYHINKMRGDQDKAREHLRTALKIFPLHEKYIELNKFENGQTGRNAQ
jgi:O-Antigen ligase